MVALLVRKSPLTVYSATRPRRSAKGGPVFPRDAIELDSSTMGYSISAPACPSLGFVGLVVVFGDDNHPPEGEQACNKLHMVIMGELITVHPCIPRSRHIRLVKKESKVPECRIGCYYLKSRKEG
jgi:hypothetical protein